MNDNIDIVEIAKFEALAHCWWDLKGEFKSLHDINPLRIDWIEQHIALANKKVLDVGCGGGILSEGMAKRGALVTGIDMGEAPLAVAELHKLESKVEIDYFKSTAENFAQQHAGQFDVVTCLEMLEHVPNPASVIKACHKLLKPNGYVFFSTINRNPKAFLLAIMGAEYILRLISTGTHNYKKFIKPSELAIWCREVGFEVQNMTGLTYNPLTKTYKLASSVDVNYMLQAQRLD